MVDPLSSKNEHLSLGISEEEPGEQYSNPLSLQQGGGSSVAQCPSELSDSGMETFFENISVAENHNSMQEATGQHLAEDSSIIIESNLESDDQNLVQRVELAACGDTITVLAPVRSNRKSVQELYGRPSWWGDIEDDCSDPRKALSDSKEGTKKILPTKLEELQNDHREASVPETSTVHPRAEAFVLDFSKPKGVSDQVLTDPKPLSQCVPERIRSAFSERERQKLEREKQREQLRRQSVPANVKQPQKSKMPSKKTIAATRPISLRTSPSASHSQHQYKVRPLSSPSNHSASSTTPTFRTRTDSRSMNASKTPSRATNSADAPKSNLHNSSNKDGVRMRSAFPSPRGVLTPTAKNKTSTPNVTSRQVQPSQTERRFSTKSGSSPRQTPSGCPARPQSTTPTSPSTSSRKIAPPIKDTLSSILRANAAKKALQNSSGERLPNAKRTLQSRATTTTKNPVSKNPIATRSNTRPGSNTNAVQRGPTPQRPNISQPNRSSPPGNSTRKPVTTTQLRRPASSSGQSRTNRPLVEMLSRRFSVHSPNATDIDLFDDPKSFLFYRMFQGIQMSNQNESTLDQTGLGTEGDSKLPEVLDRFPASTKAKTMLNETDELQPTHDVNRLESDPNKAYESFSNSPSPIVTSSRPHISRLVTNNQLAIHHDSKPTPTSPGELSASLVVSTSVTSLAPSQSDTFILDPEETLASKIGSTPTPIIDPRDRRTNSTSIRARDSVGSRTPHGSLPDVDDVYAENNSFSFRKEINESSTDLPKHRSSPILKRTAKSHLHRSSGKLFHTVSDSARLDNGRADDDSDLDRTEAPCFSTTDLNTSAMVSASITSLTPSCSGTYVLDVDETLAARGIPPIVIQSREDLLFPINQEGSHQTTRQSTSPGRRKEMLWDVIETEECSEDISMTEAKYADIIESQNAATDRAARNVHSIEEEDYPSLPNPKSNSLLDSTLPSKITLTSHDRKQSTSPAASKVQTQSSKQEHSAKSFHGSLDRPEPEETTIGLKLPALTSSSSESSSLPSSAHLSQIPFCASTLSPKAATRASAYAPLTSLHECYRALQQSVNYLIRSQEGAVGVDFERNRLDNPTTAFPVDPDVPIQVHQPYCYPPPSHYCGQRHLSTGSLDSALPDSNNLFVKQPHREFEPALTGETHSTHNVAYGYENNVPMESTPALKDNDVSCGAGPLFDTRTFTRRRKNNQDLSTQSSNDVDDFTYEQWVANMTALSNGIRNLIDKPQNKNETIVLTSHSQEAHVNETVNLPDSTTHPSDLKLADSAFTTVIPRVGKRFLRQPNVPLPSTDAVDEAAPDETAICYAMMLNSIRHLSSRLRQCSDTLIQRVNSRHSVESHRNKRQSSCPISGSTDTLAAFTNSALGEVLRNMQSIDEQIRIVDRLLSTATQNEEKISPEVEQSNRPDGRMLESQSKHTEKLGRQNIEKSLAINNVQATGGEQDENNNEDSDEYY